MRDDVDEDDEWHACGTREKRASLLLPIMEVHRRAGSISGCSTALNSFEYETVTGQRRRLGRGIIWSDEDCFWLPELVYWQGIEIVSQ